MSDVEGDDPEEEEYDESFEDSYAEDSEFEYEDEEYLDEDNMEKVEVEYTYPTSETKMGTLTHRMKYEPVDVEDVQRSLEEKVKQLDTILQIGTDECRILLMRYNWNDDKLLEDFTNESLDKFFEGSGLSKNSKPVGGWDLIEQKTDESFECHICFSSPSKDQPLAVFRLGNCDHPFCIRCYVKYIQEANANSRLLIPCPEADCGLIIRLSELQQLSDYGWKERERAREEKRKETEKQSRVPLTEEEIRQKYQRDQIEAELSEFSDLEIGEGETGENEEEKKVKVEPKNKADDTDEDPEAKLFNFQERILVQEREERERRRNQTLLSKYWFNVASKYCSKHCKSFKNCPFPDCDSLIMQQGFDSNVVATLEEFTKRQLIPTVQCSHKHEFCYSCLKGDHSPCPCSIAEKWEKKCKDDTETAHWITANTKDCPECSMPIEKNGGCNHMQCRNCNYEFCWVCLKDWACHNNSYFNCTKYVEDIGEAKTAQEKSRKSLERYLFYFRLFDNQRSSLSKDRELLEQFEGKIQEMQKKSSVSWIETLFYRESVDVLLQARRELMWSYAIMYYIDPKCPKQLVEGVQCTLSHQVEKLSRLFADTEVNAVLQQKAKFLNYSNTVKKSRDLLRETYLDCIANGVVKLTRK
ncbi:DEKNAAC103798 [Brettanomyces naardenensis]|uniref:RBR-type E3 ubiquitin transferase n=1 Tax=Brettanomyces naardenensis TaxID=13370 RepID=A0A448YPD6_BRENA|nr:DEKNAAC103798 [Brettanomyces naardenensis]